MKLSLYAEHEEFHVAIRAEYATLIEDQLNRINDEGKRREFIDALLEQFAKMLSKFLDSDLTAPTEKQIAFAHKLSRRHKVTIPRDALIYKDCMHDFLEKYASKGNAESNQR